MISTIRRWIADGPAWRWAVLPAVVAFGLSCSPRDDGELDLEALWGRLVADDGVLVFPNRSWRREGETGGSFRRTAQLLVLVEKDRPDAIRVGFLARGETRRHRFLASWDDEPLWAAPRSAESEPLTAEIGASALSPGVHRLRLERISELDDPVDRAKARNFFSTVEIERLDDGVASPVPIVANRYPARFLDFGVTGQSSTQLGGCLFLGPQTLEIEVLSRDDRVGSFTLQNQSRERARFTIEIDGVETAAVEIEPRSQRPVSFAVPAGRHEVGLEADGLASGCFLWGAPHLERLDGPSRMPVVLITLDTTRRDAVAPYSDDPEVTPVLERLSRGASVYRNAYATAPWTLPSHASIFTGLYPSRHRAGVFDDVLGRWSKTLAERFRRAGYRTAGFVGGSLASSRFGLAQGFGTYVDPRDTEEPGDVVTDAALAFIDAHHRSPLFLFLNYFDPHEMYSAPRDFQIRAGVEELSVAVEGQPGWDEFAHDKPGAGRRIRNGEVPATDAGLALLRAKYDAEVAFMDHQIGRLFNALRTHGLFDPALIVVVADHGEFLGEGGLYSHSYRLDRELVAVPLLIKWPYQATGKVVDDLVSQVDLSPTIAAAAGLDAPGTDGLAFSEESTTALRGRDRVYLEEHRSRFHQLDGPAWVADNLVGLQFLDRREIFWPGVVQCAGRVDETWVGEACGRSWDELLAGVPAEMQAAFKRDLDFSELDLDDDEAERLRALGYLQ